MADNDRNLSRRDFLAGAGALALTAGLSGSGLADDRKTTETAKSARAKEERVATRIFGKTKQPVSMLALGGIFDITANQVLLKKALDWGVTYWDTADCYMNGNSELGIGMYFEKFPAARKKVFLVSKSDQRDPGGMTELLNRSLQRMKTDHIDLYFLHGVGNPRDLSPAVKEWAEKAKKENKIRFFGFSSHSNMENVLSAAAKLGWIDGIMMTYNYRLMQTDAMKAAVEACHKAGIGLTAMKVQGGGPVKKDSQAEMTLAGHFLEKGYTPEQAKLKAVWGNEMISSICSAMYNLTILRANVAAAVDKTKLASADYDALDTYADATCSHYCAGCSEICQNALGRETQIADVLRFLMYHVNYGDTRLAREHFGALPEAVREAIRSGDFSLAEGACPRRLPIAKLMREAAEALA